MDNSIHRLFKITVLDSRKQADITLKFLITC